MPAAKTTKILILAALSMTVALTAVVYVGLLLERKGALFTENLQLSVDREAREQEHIALQDQLASTAAEREQIQQFILEGDDDTIAFLSEIDDLAASLGVTLVTEKLEVREEKNATFNMLDVTFSIDGAPGSVIHLIQLLETLPYHSHIAAATLSRNTDEATGAVLAESTVTLTLTMQK